MLGVIVKVTLVPAHMVVAVAVAVTDGVPGEVTDIVITLLVAVSVDAQVLLLVITRLTWSPLFRDVV